MNKTQSQSDKPQSSCLPKRTVVELVLLEALSTALTALLTIVISVTVTAVTGISIVISIITIGLVLGTCRSLLSRVWGHYEAVVPI